MTEMLVDGHTPGDPIAPPPTPIPLTDKHFQPQYMVHRKLRWSDMREWWDRLAFGNQQDISRVMDEMRWYLDDEEAWSG